MSGEGGTWNKTTSVTFGFEFLLKCGLWISYIIFCCLVAFTKSKDVSNGFIDFVNSTALVIVITGFSCLLLSCLLMTIKQTRIIGALATTFSANVAIFCVLCLSAVYTYKAFGLIGLIGGSLLAGYGIIATALIGVALHGGWVQFWVIAVLFLVIKLLEIFSRGVWITAGQSKPAES